MTRFPRIALLLALALTSLRAEAYHPQWSTALMQRMSGTRLFHHADFNGDGWPDFLAHSTARLNLALFNPNGTFDPYVTIYTGTSVSDTTTAEVTGDGKVDLIVADTATNTITVVPSNGDGTFATPIINNLTITPTQFARGDYNGDGKVDLAVRSHTAALLVVYAGDGAGHFTELARRGTASSLYRIVAGDI
ncbi:MAG TPA: VCBS repeat-containing protein, partial [Thermoanaerobaculia bacterium]